MLSQSGSVTLVLLLVPLLQRREPGQEKRRNPRYAAEQGRLYFMVLNEMPELLQTFCLVINLWFVVLTASVLFHWLFCMA